MGVTRTDLTSAGQPGRASPVRRSAPISTSLGLILLLIIVPVIVLRVAAELIKDGRLALGMRVARACGEATLASFRKR